MGREEGKADSRDIGNGRFVYGQRGEAARISLRKPDDKSLWRGCRSENFAPSEVTTSGNTWSLIARRAPDFCHVHLYRQRERERGGEEGRSYHGSNLIERVSMYLPFKRINTGTVYGLLIRGRPAWFSNVPPGMEIGLSGCRSRATDNEETKGYFEDFKRIFFSSVITIINVIVSRSDSGHSTIDYNWIYRRIEYQFRKKNIHIVRSSTLFVLRAGNKFFHEEARATLPKSSDFVLFSAGLFLGFAWKWNFHRWTKLMNFNKGLCPSPARRFSPVRYIARHPIIVG